MHLRRKRMIDTDEIANIRKKMESIANLSELALLKTDIKLTLDSIQEKKSLSPKDIKIITKLTNDADKLNTKTNKMISKIRKKILDVLEYTKE
jgi:hypothetical protein